MSMYPEPRRRPPLVLLVGILVGFLVAAILVRTLLPGPGDEAASPTASPAGPTSTSPPPTTTPSATREPTAQRGRLVIHGTGDVNVDPDYIPTFRTHGYGYAWSGLGGLFQRDDLTVINLECAVSNLGGPSPKEFTFRGDPAALPVMRDAGVEVANLGNNHSRDFGPEALIDTRKNLLANDIAPVGAGKDVREANQPAVLTIKGWKVAVVGFGGVVPAGDWLATETNPGMADGDDIPSMVAAVRAAESVADLVVVVIHWGVELDTTPRPEDVERAHAMIDAGADIIFGHHSHRLNPMGTYRDRPIFWSLGNFVWPNFSVEGSTTAVAEVVVEPDGSTSGRLIPAFIEAPGHPVLRGS